MPTRDNNVTRRIQEQKGRATRNRLSKVALLKKQVAPPRKAQKLSRRLRGVDERAREDELPFTPQRSSRSGRGGKPMPKQKGRATRNRLSNLGSR